MASRTLFTRALAGIGVALVGAALALTGPLAASAATTNYTLDCNSLPYSSQSFYVAPGDTATFALTGFDDLYDLNANASIRALNPAGDTVVMSDGDWFEFWDSTNTCTDYFDAEVIQAAPETVPSGSLLFTQDMSLSGTPSSITVTDNSAGAGDHYLDNNPDCAISANVHGIHVYSTLDITVTAAGTFTFRGLHSSPEGYYVGLNVYDPIGDPFLAVYSTFDPANPDTGVLGCNDDLNDIGPQNDAEYRTGGSIIDGHQSYFTAAFTPGQYELVLMTYSDLSPVDFATGVDQYEGDTFAIGTKTTTFELWGPAGALSLGHTAPAAGPTGPALAATGQGNVGGFWIGGTVVVVGVTLAAIGYRRRRVLRKHVAL